MGERGRLRCVHHVPGRLRLKSASLKGNPAALRAICHRIDALPGATAATASPVTGSILIRYDPLVVPPDAVEERLQGLGLLAAAPPGNSDVGPSLGDRLADAALRHLLDHVVEALAFAALQAL